MSTLARYNIQPSNDATALLHNRQNVLSAAEFFSRAPKLLDQLGNVVAAEIIPNLEHYRGRWHPTGFMAYPLGVHPQLGDLRLHIWPKGLRQRRLIGKGPMGEIHDGDIHDHSWNIVSLVMEFYSDNFYDVSSVPGESLLEQKDSSRFRVYNVTYAKNGRQGLATSGNCVEAGVKDVRAARRGDFHTIDAGVFHAPTIPEDKLGATLVFSSPRVATSGPDILIAGTKDPIFDIRRVITTAEARLAKSQLTAKSAVLR